MSKWEKRQFFERLIELRALYALRGSEDSVSLMTISEAIAHAEDLLDSPAALAMAIGPLEVAEQQAAASDQSSA